MRSAMQHVCNIQPRLPFQRYKTSLASRNRTRPRASGVVFPLRPLKARNSAVSASFVSKIAQHLHCAANTTIIPLHCATSIKRLQKTFRGVQCHCSTDSGKYLNIRSTLKHGLNTQPPNEGEQASIISSDSEFAEEKAAGDQGKAGDVERLRLATGIPMVAWYSKSPAENWTSQISESPTTMKMVALVSVVLAANMTSMMFSLFFALVGTDAVSVVRQSHPSGPLILLVNFLFFGIGPKAFVQMHKSTVRGLLAPLKTKHKDQTLWMSEQGAGDVEKWLGGIIQVLTFDQADHGTDADLNGLDKLDIDIDDYSA